MKFVIKIDNAIGEMSTSIGALESTVGVVKAATEQNTASIQILERQVGQIAEAMQTHAPGQFPVRLRESHERSVRLST